MSLVFTLSEVSLAPTDLIALSETWLKSSDCLNLYKIPGYHPIITHNRDNKLGGGVAIYVKEDFEYDTVENHASMEILKLRTECWQLFKRAVRYN